MVHFEHTKSMECEIDDGLKPYCFFVHEYGIELLAYFDRDSARKNELDRTDLEEPNTDFCS